MNPTIKPIHTESDYLAALAELEAVFDAKPGTPEADRLEVLGTLIAVYEAEHHPIGGADPVEVILFYMEQNDLMAADLAKVLGSRSHASDVLSRRRRLSIAMIRKLVTAWSLPADVLIQESRVLSHRPLRSKSRRRRAA